MLAPLNRIDLRGLIITLAILGVAAGAGFLVGLWLGS
jgi:hypothetical protein